MGTFLYSYNSSIVTVKICLDCLYFIGGIDSIFSSQQWRILCKYLDDNLSPQSWRLDSLNPPLPWMGFPQSWEVSPPDLSFSGRDKSSITRHQHPSWAHMELFLMSFGRKHGKVRKIRRIFLAPRLPGVCSLVQGRILCLQSNKAGRSLFWREGYGIASVRPEFYPSASGSTMKEAAAGEVVRWETRLLHYCSYTRDSRRLKAQWELPACCIIFSWDLFLRFCSVLFPDWVQKSSYFPSSNFHKETTSWKNHMQLTDATNIYHSYLCLFLISLYTMLK